jgi:hypothetical protein
MTVIAAIFFPLVLVYQSWSYHLFRSRFAAPKVESDGAEVASATVSGSRRSNEAIGSASESGEPS